VLQSEVGEARPDGMHLMLSSAAHRPSKLGSPQSWQLSSSSFSHESERLVNNSAEILVLYAGRRSMFVCTCVSPPFDYLLYKHEQRQAKIPGRHLSVAQNSGERSQKLESLHNAYGFISSTF